MDKDLSLPNELLFMIGEYMSLEVMIKCNQVNKRMSEIMSAVLIRKYRANYPDVYRILRKLKNNVPYYKVYDDLLQGRFAKYSEIVKKLNESIYDEITIDVMLPMPNELTDDAIYYFEYMDYLFPKESPYQWSDNSYSENPYPNIYQAPRNIFTHSCNHGQINIILYMLRSRDIDKYFLHEMLRHSIINYLNIDTFYYDDDNKVWEIELCSSINTELRANLLKIVNIFKNRLGYDKLPGFWHEDSDVINLAGFNLLMVYLENAEDNEGIEFMKGEYQRYLKNE